MILIHVWSDGSFTTQHGGPDMSPWEEHQQAAKNGCQQTLMAPVMAGAAFRYRLDELAQQYLTKSASDPTMGKWHMARKSSFPKAQAWHLWAAECMREFGAFFTVVTCASSEEILQARLKRLIATRGEVSFGTLVNLVRPIRSFEVGETLGALARKGEVKCELRPNPKNGKEASIFSLT